ncbi:hypothetical protein T03_17720 [Trichinella britovi]|uniref:Uncharacterized protein n=1 Tax=Trichinella britovi TaxID=45882 RepID=A0A0V1D778_TRIBR|nr:hypothetical protein T03_17720 [Trichinella britovi]
MHMLHCWSGPYPTLENTCKKLEISKFSFFYVTLVGFCTIALHPSWSLNAVLCFGLALRGALYALHVLINVASLRNE